MDSLDEQICYCGSGQFRDDCTDPDKAHRWQVVDEIHYARAAIEREQEQQKEPEPGTLLSVRLLPNGQLPVSPNELKAADAAAEVEAMLRRHGKA